MWKMTVKVLRPWKQHGGHPRPLLACQEGQCEDSHYREGWSMETQPHLYQIITFHCGFLLEPHSTNVHPGQDSLKSASVWDFFFFFLLFLFFLPVLEINRIEVVSNCTLSSHHLERHRPCFSMIVKPSSQWGSFVSWLSQTFDVLLS